MTQSTNKLTLKKSGVDHGRVQKGIQVEIRRSSQDKKSPSVASTPISPRDKEKQKELLAERKKQLQATLETTIDTNKKFVKEQSLVSEQYQVKKDELEQSLKEHEEVKNNEKKDLLQASHDKSATQTERSKTKESLSKDSPSGASPSTYKDTKPDSPYKKPSKLSNKNNTIKPSRKVSVYKILENSEREFDTYRGASIAALRRRREKDNNKDSIKKIQRTVKMDDVIALDAFASQMSERVDTVIKTAKALDIPNVTKYTKLEADYAELIAEELGHKFERIASKDSVDISSYIQETMEENLVHRAPIVAVMGHVDHGKTSLLDYIRSSKVTEGEAGGITQHIGAYQVQVQDKWVTFLDTPGHAAFTSMRMRGAQVTDIALLLVAADDGIQPQTIEAIAHIQSANVPMIVVITKIDKPDSNVDKVLETLLNHNVVVEKFGGDIQHVGVSSMTGEHVDDLLNAILLQSEMLDLKADPKGTALGVVLESKLDKDKGVLTTVIVKNGTVSVGDAFLSGLTYGKIKRQFDFLGQSVKSAVPSTPIEIMGFRSLPEAGNDFVVFKKESEAEKIASHRLVKFKEQIQQPISKFSLDEFLKIQNDDQQVVSLILKTDVAGSLEAVVSSVLALNEKTDEILVKIIFQGVGGITNNDIDLAKTTGAQIVGFNIHIANKIKQYANSLKINIYASSIIYEIIEYINQMMSGLLKPIEEEQYLGTASVRQIFKIKGVGAIAGCVVQDGVIQRQAHAKLIRESKVVFNGSIKQLKHLKDTVNEVQSGQECGITFENFEDIHIGDEIECFAIEQKLRTL